MYEMLTGKVPFDADTSVSVALKHMQEDPVPPMEINENVPKAVNDIILKAMEKEPMARYQTATQMLKDLSRSLKDPDGDFVEEEDLDEGYTRRMDAITDDMLDDNYTKKKKKQGKLGKYFSEHPRMKIVAIILICFIIFLASIGITSAILNATSPKDVQIPNLVGLTEDQAKAELEKHKLNYQKTTEDYNPDYPAGQIYEQTPTYAENYKVKENTTVSVKVSKGTETTVVPKVAGMTYDEAVKELEKNKLKAEKVEETSKDIKEGIVISQETEANTTINAGETIKIHVSIGTGIQQVVMPNVVGNTEESARTTLTGKKLTVRVEYEEDTTKDNGVVLRQSIDSGTNIDEGTEVVLTVNKLTETKTLDLTINVKKITGGYEEESEEQKVTNTTETGSNSNKAKTATVVVTVNGEEKYTDSNVDKNISNKKVQVSGVGRIEVKLTITDKNGGNWTRTQTIDLNTTSSYTFE